MGFDPSELRKISEAGRVISRETGIAVETWARSEAAAILSGWASGVKQSTVTSAERRARNKTLKDAGLTQFSGNTSNLTINSGVRGKEGTIWRRNKRAGTFYAAGAVGHNGGGVSWVKGGWAKAIEVASAYVGELPAALAIGRRTIGLARQSIVQIADSIGLDLGHARAGTLSAADASAARNAVASDGKVYQNGHGSQQKTETSYSLELVNTYPKIQQAKLDAALEQVLARRISVAKGELNNDLSAALRRTSRACPWVEVVT